MEEKDFLIIQPAFIGDVILATSIVETIASVFPNQKIDFLVRKGNEIILKNNPHIKKVYVWDKKQNKYSNLWNIIREIRSKKYFAIINIHRFFTSGLITLFAKAHIKSGYKSNPLSFFFTHRIPFVFGDGTHEIERNFTLISFLDKKIKLQKPKIYPSQEDFNKVSKYKANKYVCIAPASVWHTKQFPPEKWIKFIDNYLPTDYNVFLLGAKQDINLCNEIKHKSKTNSRIEILAGNLSLLESAALMKDSIMNYVNDSAPLHLCSAVNAPVTAVYCSTIPEFGFYPLSDISKIVQTTKKLECRPCGIHGKNSCPLGHFDCANTIDEKQLLWKKLI